MKHLLDAVTLVVSCAALALPPAMVHAQKSVQPAATMAKSPDASDPKAAVPPLLYRSAFQSYRPNTEVEVGDWKAAHDEVGRIGGWRTYAKEAAQPGAPASAPAGHADHKMP